MGAGESVIRNMDKRTARREHREVFAAAIAEAAAKAAAKAEAAAAARAAPESGADAAVDQVRVYIRKRPIFEHELKAKEFDVVSCLGGTRLTIHDARMQADMRNRYLDHHSFDFDHVFSERDDSDAVFEQVVGPLCELVRGGGNGTVLMYGQTGSGKTFTMSHIYQRASWALFGEALSQATPTAPVAYVSFVELAGDECLDMLNHSAKLQLLTCPNGDVLSYPCVQLRAESPQDVHECIKFACGLRATAATGVHDRSSRSHALCRIELEGGNALTLVDLAGSERRIDSAEHDAQRRKESAQINSSLMKLKECIRARAKAASYIPYRHCALTHLLRPSFVDDGFAASKTAIIATVSPSSKDTEHSLNTVSSLLARSAAREHS